MGPPLLLLLLLIHLAAVAATSPSPSTALFVLGDSTVSCADSLLLPFNLSSISSHSCLLSSSRRLLPDLLAAKMGLPPPPPFSALNGTAAAAAAGVNFGGSTAASASAAAGEPFLMEAVGQQLRLAEETLQLARLEAAPDAAAAAAAAAVFVLSFGADGYARLLARGAESDVAAPKYGRRGFGRLLAARLARAVSELYEADVRRVAVMGVGPLGCTPRIMWEGLHMLDGRNCVEEANEVIQGYNARLAAELDALRPQLPGAEIVFCDMYKGMMQIISNPHNYGFQDIREACCGLGPFGGMIGCLTKEMACTTPQSHVWWDLYSPTEAVNSLLANWSWSAPPARNISICHPITLQQLAGHESSV